MKTRRLVSYVLLFFYTFSVASIADNYDWDPAKRVPIRDKILSCATFVSVADPKVNDTVGVQISSTNKIEQFEIDFKKAIEDRGIEGLKGSHLFVTGVQMKDEKATALAYQDVLRRLGFNEGDIRVRVLSVPRKLVLKLSREGAASVLERLAYFFPSIKRDYQTPLRSEVVSGVLSDAMIETANVAYLYKAMPLLDANLTVATHAALLVVYSVYKKFMINWLLRPGSGNMESFLKQLSLSFPFVVNYNIFGNLSKILAFYNEHGFKATSARFPGELATFATTQGFTIFLQTLFYNLVISKGVRAWENRQQGEARSDAARSLTNWINVPILTLDAFFLAMAAANKNPLMQLGPMDLNAGHACLALLSVAGSALWIFPKALDPTLDWYFAVKRFFGKFRAHLITPETSTPVREKESEEEF